MITPQQEYRIAYDRNGVKLNLTWTAMAEPHPGWFRGTLDLEGEIIEIDCGALRDRGWGPRHADIKDPLRAGWPYVFASPESGWHLYDPQTTLSFDEDPIAGTTETVTTGLYIRDGIKAQVVGGTRTAVRGRDGRVLTQVIDCVDELGRELHAEGQTMNWLKWPINSDILNWWSMVRWSYDGQVVYGEDQGFMNFRHYRRYWRQLLEKDPGLLPFFPDSPDYPPYGK